MKSNAAANVDEYMNALPENKRTALEKVRKTIRSAVPQAEEVISYQIPTLKYKGKALVGYAAFKDHCSFFPMNSGLIKKFSEELKFYETAKGTIRFTIKKPLPDSLIKKFVKIRMKENEEKILAKKE